MWEGEMEEASGCTAKKTSIVFVAFSFYVQIAGLYLYSLATITIQFYPLATLETQVVSLRSFFKEMRDVSRENSETGRDRSDFLRFLA